jgi:hypothetical protein
MAVLWLVATYFFLHEDMAWDGALLALVTVAALLGAVITCGVAVSAVVNSTVVGMAVLWLALYGTGFLLSVLPDRFPAPERTLNTLPYVLRGYYDLGLLCRIMIGSALASCVAALFGMLYFARRDV